MNKLDEIIECNPDTEFLKADGFDEAVLGFDNDSERLIYSISKCVDILVLEGMDMEEAKEYLWFNTIGSYVGPKTPIWCNDL
jgi:hypothetical protein